MYSLHMIKQLTAVLLVGIGMMHLPSTNAVTLCDKYTIAKLTNNTAANQLTLLTILVNTVVIGNYSSAGDGSYVPGILAQGTYQGVSVNLLPFFDGQSGATTNGGTGGTNQVSGSSSVATSGVNFLDGGGAAPLLLNMPANSATSNQYGLLTHLYEFFGVLLGCSMQSMTDPSPTTASSTAYPFGNVQDNGGFNSYQGNPSMYDVHRFMNLTAADVGYFITQVALAANSLGVSDADIDSVGVALATTFTELCSPPAAVVTGISAQPQAICNDVTCSKASSDSSCSAYPDGSAMSQQVSQLYADSKATSTSNTTQSFGQTLLSSPAVPTFTPKWLTTASLTLAALVLLA